MRSRLDQNTLEPSLMSRAFPSVHFLPSQMGSIYPSSFFRFQSFDRNSTPLKPRPNEKNEPDARFVAKPPDKFSGSEKENLFVMLEVFGDPVPRVEWYKVRALLLIQYILNERMNVRAFRQDLPRKRTRLCPTVQTCKSNERFHE